VGVVITVAFDTGKGKRKGRHDGRQSAKIGLWERTGVILHEIVGGGIPEVAMALTAERCEELVLGLRSLLSTTYCSRRGWTIPRFSNVPEVDCRCQSGDSWTPPSNCLRGKGDRNSAGDA